MTARHNPESRILIPRRVLLLFIAVGFTFIVQMVWWIIFFINTMKGQIPKRHLVMLITEGGFFLLLILAGLYLIYRTLRQHARLEQQSKDFFAGFSHELKTPMASLKLHVETLLARELPSQKRHDLLGNMLEDLERLELSIENILDIFKFESGSLQLVMEKVEIDDWIQKIMKSLAQSLSEKDLKLETALQCKATVAIDKRYFQSVLANILQNAVRYTGANPLLKITSEVDGQEVKLRFCDNGIGIEQSEIEQIFEKYYRIRSDNSLKWKGSGLGLFISRQIINAHGGSIRAQSDGCGKGTTFIIALPKVD